MALYMKSKNLIPFPYLFTEQTKNGVTARVNGDGSITLNGTSTAYTEFYFHQAFTITEDGEYTVSGSVRNAAWNGVAFCRNGKLYIQTLNGSTNQTGTLKKGDTIRGWVGAAANAQYDNVTLYPMFAKSTTPLPYERGGGTKVRLARKSNNLIRFPYTCFKNTNVVEQNGITFTCLEDGGIKVQGTNGNGFAAINLGYHKLPEGVNIYAWSKDRPQTGGGVTISYAATGESKGIVLANSWGNTIIWLRVDPNVVVDCVVYPMLNKGTAPLPYEQGSKPVYIKVADNSDNLIPFPYEGWFEKKVGVAKTTNGLTLTVQEDGGVKVQGTATAGMFLNFGFYDFAGGAINTLGNGVTSGSNKYYTFSINEDEKNYNVGLHYGGGSDVNGNKALALRFFVDKTYDCVVYPKLTKVIKK